MRCSGLEIEVVESLCVWCSWLPLWGWECWGVVPFFGLSTWLISKM